MKSFLVTSPKFSANFRSVITEKKRFFVLLLQPSTIESKSNFSRMIYKSREGEFG